MSVTAAGWWGRHGVHTLTVLGPVLVLALVALGADLRAWRRKRGVDRSTRRTPALMLGAAAMSAGAGVVHVIACPEHFGEAFLYGLFMAVSAGCQLGWSLIVVSRFGRWTIPVGLAGNAAIVLLWTFTRTVGIPLGPEAGEVERIGGLDALATGCEIAVVALCVLAIRQHVPSWRTPHRSDCAKLSSTG
jgi:hypothetical protein